MDRTPPGRSNKGKPTHRERLFCRSRINPSCYTRSTSGQGPPHPALAASNHVRSTLNCGHESDGPEAAQELSLECHIRTRRQDADQPAFWRDIALSLGQPKNNTYPSGSLISKPRRVSWVSMSGLLNATPRAANSVAIASGSNART